MFGTDGTAFLEQFFLAGGKHPKGEETFRFFQEAFIRPSDFDAIVKDLTPDPDYQRVIVVDGHPRSGKTWCIAAAVAQSLDNMRMTADECYTLGADSLKLFAGNEDITRAAEQISEDLQRRPCPRFVLLDDFLGTYKLRSLGDDARRFLLWNEENPWLHALGPGCTLILTGRSVLLTLAGIILQLSLREGASAGRVSTHRIRVINHRRGVFRSETGELFGAFDENTLKAVCDSNRRNHPFADDTEWLTRAVPVLVLSGEQVSSREMDIAAGVWFGDDIEAIADEVRRAEELGSGMETALAQLDRAYLLCIAPGLLFLGRNAYESLGIPRKTAEVLLRDLYLREAINEFCSGRLPNEFYMIAVKAHFNLNLPLVARVFVRVMKSSGTPVAEVGLGLRGLIERGLDRAPESTEELLKQAPDLKSLVIKFQRERHSYLLYWETQGNEPPSEESRLPLPFLQPGLAAALGWALYKFSGLQAAQPAVLDWFSTAFKGLIQECKSATQQLDIRDKLLATVVTYSTFLQWAIRMQSTPYGADMLDRTAAMVRLGNQELNRRLAVVLEDELIWGLTRDESCLSQRVAVKVLLEGIALDVKRDCGDYLLANRLFSLAWHNEWMLEDTQLAAVATDWIRERKKQALDAIVQKPWLLTDNLEYHWCHFITQHAVWMRDWCFEPDPERFARDRVAPGSHEPAHNELFADIAMSLLKGNVDQKSLQHLFFLLGTREARVLRFANLAKMIEDKCNEGKSSETILRALFELARQGYLDARSRSTTVQFRDWCRHYVRTAEELIDGAWKPYKSELQSMTHLDLLPRSWQDIEPEGWQ